MWYFGCVSNKRNGLRLFFIVQQIEYFYMQMSLRVFRDSLNTLRTEANLCQATSAVYIPEKWMLFCDSNIMKMHETQTGDRSSVRFVNNEDNVEYCWPYLVRSLTTNM